jgi:signal transduction histidine kinase
MVTDGEIRAAVDDDGKGFDAAGRSIRGLGSGLSSMRDRVRLLGGTLDVVSAPGKGTTISLCIERPQA